MKQILVIILLAITTIGVSAQRQQKKFDPEAYKTEQHKFIQQRVKFSAEESAKFFKLLDEMRAKERQLFDRNKRSKMKRPTTDAECSKAITEHDNIDLQIKKIQQLYHRRMLKVVPAKKLLDAIFAAEEFDREMFREMSGGKPMGKDGKRGPRPGKRGPRPGDKGPHPGDGGPRPGGDGSHPEDGGPRPDMPIDD